MITLKIENLSQKNQKLILIFYYSVLKKISYYHKLRLFIILSFEEFMYNILFKNSTKMALQFSRPY